jgi:hypothetical protein
MPTLTDDLSLKLAEALRRLPIALACDLVGLPRSTYYDWMARGEREEQGPLAEFRRLVLASRARYVDDTLKAIEEAARKKSKGDWKAAAWYLERCYPDHFSPRSKLEHSGPNGGPLPLRVELLSDEHLDQLESILGRLVEAGPRPDAQEGPSGTLPTPPQ